MYEWILCVKKFNVNVEVFFVLYVEDIFLIGNDVGVLSSLRVWLSSQVDMKDLVAACHILGFKLLWDCKNRTLGFSQATSIANILAWFSIHDSRKRLLTFRYGITLSKDQSPKKPDEIEKMKAVPYVSAVESQVYAILYTKPDIFFDDGMDSRYQSNPVQEYWTAVKNILKYLKSTRDYMLVYQADSIVPIRYTDSNFMSDGDSRKSS